MLELVGEEPAGGPDIEDGDDGPRHDRSPLSLTVIVSVPPDATPLPSPPRSRTVVPAKTGIGHSAEWSFIYWKALAPRYYTMELNSPK